MLRGTTGFSCASSRHTSLKDIFQFWLCVGALWSYSYRGLELPVVDAGNWIPACWMSILYLRPQSHPFSFPGWVLLARASLKEVFNMAWISASPLPTGLRALRPVLHLPPGLSLAFALAFGKVLFCIPFMVTSLWSRAMSAQGSSVPLPPFTSWCSDSAVAEGTVGNRRFWDWGPRGLFPVILWRSRRRSTPQNRVYYSS